MVVLNARNTKELAEYKGKLKGAVILRGAPAKVAPVGERVSDPFAAMAGGGPRGNRLNNAFRGNAKAPWSASERRRMPPKAKML